jgi:Protein of unknown function (DUF433)
MNNVPSVTGTRKQEVRRREPDALFRRSDSLEERIKSVLNMQEPRCLRGDIAVATGIAYPHIEKQDEQPARLERVPRIRVAQIVMDYVPHGWSPDEMCRQHPRMTLSEAHSAIAYYFNHQAEIDQEIGAELEQAWIHRVRRQDASRGENTIAAHHGGGVGAPSQARRMRRSMNPTRLVRTVDVRRRQKEHASN